MEENVENVENTENIAIYWDFENIHASIGTIKWGSDWYRENRRKIQEKLVEIKDIMEYASSVGNININKAYGNWVNFQNYSFDLQDESIDLIQLFPRGSHGKNGADIRMAIDVIEDIVLYRHITSIIVIGGDSDYISIAQHVRQKGKKIIGIGVKETTNQFWIKSCNEFKFYSSLLLRTAKIDNLEKEGYEEPDIDEAKQLLIKALKSLNSKTGGTSSERVKIKPIMLRLDPSFDESNYGFKSFTEFLNACREIIDIKIKEGDKDQQISLKEISVKHADVDKIQNNYETTLKKQQIRLICAAKMKDAISETYSLFKTENSLDSYAHYTELLVNRMRKKHPTFTLSDANKIRVLIYKTFSFTVEAYKNKIQLSRDIKTAEDLLFKVHYLIIKRILDNVQESEVDESKLSKLIHGDEKSTDNIRLLIAEYNKRN